MRCREAPIDRIAHVACQIIDSSTCCHACLRDGERCLRSGRHGLFNGSRGLRSYSMPAPTPISPYASPLQRSYEPYAPPVGYPGGFEHGFFGGLMGGLLGAGLLGLLFGHGFYGGLGGGFSFLGLLLQIGLLFLIVRFVMSFFGNRRQPAFYGAPQTGGACTGGWSGGYGASGQGTPLPIAAEDFDAFERLLKRDSRRLRRRKPRRAAPSRDAGDGVLFCRGTRRQCTVRTGQPALRRKAPSGQSL